METNNIWKYTQRNYINIYYTCLLNMATLQALAISGIRSYNPEKLQRIDFTHPITLINGKNGSGKTTIIECLKYITTGVLPTLINRENCFVMDPSIAGTAEVKGDVRLRFRTAKNRVVIAKKVLMVSKKQNKKNLESRAIELSLKTKDDDGKEIEVSQKCTDIQKQIPEMLGISKPILNNIVFCHQDDSLWPFSENNVLKNIFDQLFDTKRFTKSLENMKEALKDYEKEKTELKAQMEYLRIGYVKYYEQQTQTLTGLLEVAQTSQELAQLRQKLKPLSEKLKEINEQQKERNDLIGEKGVLEYKIVEIRNKITQIQAKQQQYREDEYQQINFTNEVNKQNKEDGNQIYVKLERIGEQIEKGEKELRMLERLLQESKDKEATDRRKKQLITEINRLKQIMPELVQDKAINTAVGFIAEVQKRVKKMKSMELAIAEGKSKMSKMPLMGSFPQPDIQDPAKLQSKATNIRADKQRIEKRIRSIYAALYCHNLEQETYISGESKKAGERLAKLQAQVQLKKSQLKKYQEMQPRNKSLEKEIYEYKYTYIDLQNEMLDYMKRKKECGMCMRKLDDEQFLKIKDRIKRTIEKGQARIDELKSTYNPVSDIDPTPIIKEIESFIESSSKSMRALQQEKAKYEKYVQNEQKREINKELNKMMASIQLKSENFKTDRSENGSIDKFRQLIAEYKTLAVEERNVVQELHRSRQKMLQFQKQQNQAAIAAQQRSQLEKNIIQLQPQVKYLPIVQNMLRKIQDLEQVVRRDQEKHSSSDESSNELINRIDVVEAVLSNKRSHKERLQLRIEQGLLQSDLKELETKLSEVLMQLQSIQKKKSQCSQLQKQQSSLLLAQATLNQKHRSKKSLYTCAPYLEQPPYLQKLLRYNNLCSMISDIGVSIKCMQRATNRLHNEKMDQINKILFDIWQEVYHAKDIEYIRIDAVAERKIVGYGYCIQMKKNGQMIDMKGRCSMGQKVLASIIIRMALAQAFSASAHILTLDQPTTNLDRIHIENLAQSISSIIQMEQSSRLQLVIISHDMEFIKLLKKHTNFFYEITRDNRNFSIITKKDIVELGDQIKIGGIEAVHY